MKAHEGKEPDQSDSLNIISTAADMMLVVCNDILGMHATLSLPSFSLGTT
jgi:hypothetical protein